MFTNLLHKRTSIVSFVFKCGLLKSLSIIISLSPTYTKQKHRLATCLINCIISRHPRVGRGRHQFFSDGKYHCSTSGQATSALTMRSRTSGSPRGGRRPKRKFVSTWFEFLFKQHWQWKKTALQKSMRGTRHIRSHPTPQCRVLPPGKFYGMIPQPLLLVRRKKCYGTQWHNGKKIQGDHSPDNVKFPDDSRTFPWQFTALLPMPSVTHIMPVPVY